MNSEQRLAIATAAVRRAELSYISSGAYPKHPKWEWVAEHVLSAIDEAVAPFDLDALLDSVADDAHLQRMGRDPKSGEWFVTVAWEWGVVDGRRVCLCGKDGTGPTRTAAIMDAVAKANAAKEAHQ